MQWTRVWPVGFDCSYKNFVKQLVYIHHKSPNQNFQASIHLMGMFLLPNTCILINFKCQLIKIHEANEEKCSGTTCTMQGQQYSLQIHFLGLAFKHKITQNLIANEMKPNHIKHYVNQPLRVYGVSSFSRWFSPTLLVEEGISSISSLQMYSSSC